MKRSAVCLSFLLALVLLAGTASATTADEQQVTLLVAALLGDTPMIEDLRVLTDEIGGRPTGSAANIAAVEWAVAR
jgi:hypothetical protein